MQKLWLWIIIEENKKISSSISGGKKAISEHAAVWVPDGEAPVCMHCKKTQFTLLNRRVRILSTFGFW